MNEVEDNIFIPIIFQTSFKIPQSLGVIGGKPNLALYFIGCVGMYTYKNRIIKLKKDTMKIYTNYNFAFAENEVIYLDPHTTQRSGSVGKKLEEEEIEMDATYHCKSSSRIPITGIDPSVALVSI